MSLSSARYFLQKICFDEPNLLDFWRIQTFTLQNNLKCNFEIQTNKKQPPKKISAFFVIYRTRGEKNLWDQMFTMTLIFYQKTKRIMSPRGCWLKMWSLMQAALALLYCLKKEQILWSQPRAAESESLEWQPKACVLSTFPHDSYAWLRSSDAKYWTRFVSSEGPYVSGPEDIKRV